MKINIGINKVNHWKNYLLPKRLTLKVNTPVYQWLCFCLLINTGWTHVFCNKWTVKERVENRIKDENASSFRVNILNGELVGFWFK